MSLVTAKEDCKKIPLANSDYFTLVDSLDYDYLMQWQWSITYGFQKQPLVMRRFGHHRMVFLHKEVMKLSLGDDCDDIYAVTHINNNTLDNCRGNLKATTHRKKRYTNKVFAQSGLTPRLKEVANLVSMGLTNPQIATELHISQKTVASHVGNLIKRLGRSTRTDLAIFLIYRQTEIAQYKYLPPLNRSRRETERLKNQRILTYQVVNEARSALALQIEQLEQICDWLDKTMEVINKSKTD